MIGTDHRGRAPVLGRVLALGRPARAGLVWSALAGVAAIGCSVALLATSGWLLARASQSPELAELAIAIVGVRAFGIGRAVSRYAERLSSHDASLRIARDLRVDVYGALARVSPEALRGRSGGELLARVIDDVGQVQEVYLRGLTPPVVALVVAIGSVALSWVLLPAAGLALAAWLVAAGVVVPVLAARSGRRWGGALVESRGALATATIDLVQGAPELLAFGAEAQQLDAVMAADRRLAGAARMQSATEGRSAAALTAATGGAVASAVLLGLLAAHAGQLDGVAVPVLALAAWATFEAVEPLVDVAGRAAAIRHAAGRVIDLLDTADPVPTPEQPRLLSQGPHHLELRGVGLRAGTGGPLLFDGLDLDLAPGRRVVLVGPSGVGKTSLAETLVAFRALDRGTVLLDGHDLRSYAPADVRRVIGLVEQRAHVFDGTLRDNLLLARPDASDAELDRVAERVGLAAWVASLPAGWSTRVGEHGDALSGGERQRLALARALLADFPILVVDEPTASLDPAVADSVTADLLRATADRTVLFITHRLAGIDSADAVVDLGGLAVGASEWPAQPGQMTRVGSSRAPGGGV